MFNRKRLLQDLTKYAIKSVVAVSIAAVLIFILINQISKTSDSIQRDRLNAAILDRRIETISDLRNRLELANTDYMILLDTIPATDNLLGFVSAVENAAIKNGIKPSMRFGQLPEIQPGNLATIEYNIDISGSVSTLINYLKTMEELKFITGTSSFTITSSTSSSWNSSSSITMSGKILVRSN